MKYFLILALLISCSSTKNVDCAADDLTCPKQRFVGDDQVQVQQNPDLDSQMPQHTPSGDTSDYLPPIHEQLNY